MRIEAMREFIEVARYQSISLAAKKLYITQPALSNHIAGMEKELNTALVRRGQAGQACELTEAGRAFFEGCCDIVGRYDRLSERVHSLEGQGEPESLSIKGVAGAESGTMRLLELVNGFQRENPSVSVHVATDTRGPVTEALSSGALDCALMYNVADASAVGEGFRSLVIDRAPYGVAAAATHPLMSREKVAFEDILPYPYAMPAGVQFEECEISVRQLYRRHGAELGEVHYKVVGSITELASAQTTGLEVILLASSPVLVPGMAYREFEPAEYQDFCLVCWQGNRNPALARFMAYAETQRGRSPS